MMKLLLFIFTALAFATTSLTLAAPEAAPPAKPTPAPAIPPTPNPGETPPKAKPAEALPDLDSLLGTKPEKKPSPDKPDPAKPGIDPSRKELERQLSMKEQADEFAKAVQLMDETADRVESDKDTGIETQRLQEDILTRLDRLIKAAQKNKSSKSQQQQQQDKQNEQNQNMRQQSQAQSKQAANNPAESSDGPARQDGQLGTPPPAAPAAWGDLPAHVRDSLMQGFSDKFSSMYQTMTESYYRKLAEEKKK